MCAQVAIINDLKNFIKALICVLKKVVFVTAVPKGKKLLHSKKRQYKYTKLLQYIGYLDIKINKVGLDIIFCQHELLPLGYWVSLKGWLTNI